MYSGDFLDQKVNAAWIDINACLLYNESDYDLMEKTRPHQEGKIIVGVDVAVGGDKSCSTVIDGNRIVSILARKTSTDVATLLDLIRDSLGGLTPDYVCVDSTGVGAFAAAEIRKRWPSCVVVPVNFGDKAIKQGYENRRVEIHFDLRSQIEKGLHFGPSISEEVKKSLLKQMRATEYMIGRKSMYKLIGKNEIKLKIGQSPDELDSVALASSLDQAVLISMQRQEMPTFSGVMPSQRN